MYAERLNNIAPFRVMELLQRAQDLERAGHRVAHLEVGEPDFDTATPIAEAGIAAIESGQTKYTPALGEPALRQQIAAHYRELGVDVPWQRVLVTSGASGGLALLSGLLLEPGARLLVTDPGYPCNEAFAALVNAQAVRVPVAASRFQLSAEQVRAKWHDAAGEPAAGLLLASPANPTGVMQTRRNLQAVLTEVRGSGGFTIVDEIYQGLVYQPQPEYRSALQLDSEAFVLNSFSKYFGMTGWRLGWLVVPESAVEPLTRLAQNLFISPSAISQRAALAAFSGSAMQIHENRRLEFAKRRELLAAGLQELGFQIPVMPDGAFYLYVDVSRCGLDSQTFCQRLLTEYHVAATPGIDFGEHGAERFVRFAYTTDLASLEFALDRLAAALAAWE